MGLLTSFLSDALHLLVTGLDVLCFFVVVRLLAHHLNFPGLTAFDNVGRPLVRWSVTHAQRGLDRINPRNRSEQTLLAYGLLIAATIRFLLAAVAAALSAA
jgi:hypothetical protein